MLFPSNFVPAVATSASNIEAATISATSAKYGDWRQVCSINTKIIWVNAANCVAEFRGQTDDLFTAKLLIDPALVHIHGEVTDTVRIAALKMHGSLPDVADYT